MSVKQYAIKSLLLLTLTTPLLPATVEKTVDDDKSPIIPPVKSDVVNSAFVVCNCKFLLDVLF